MLMSRNGIDIFYIDESHDQNIYLVTAICVPMLRRSERLDGRYDIVWPDNFAAIKAWRQSLASIVKIPASKELHGHKLASGRGNFLQGKYNFDKAKASSVYRSILRSLDVLPPISIMSAVANRSAGDCLYGRKRLEAALYALFQRMRTRCEKTSVNAMVFFDQGHPKYRTLYRQARKFLPTGSSRGSWASGDTSKNMPLTMFFEDGNEKSSAHCYYTQLADVIAYAAFLKVKHERGELTDWQAAYALGTLYDEIPQSKLNLAVTYKTPKDAILRL